MRLAVFTSSLILFASSASAGSIESVVSSNRPTPSQTQVVCESCPPAPETKVVDTNDKWDPNTESVDIKDVNGIKKRFAKEAWFGGSPVVFVTKVPGQNTLDTAAVQPMPGVDPAATTSALNDIKNVEPVKADVAPVSAEATTPAEAPAEKPRPRIPKLHEIGAMTGMGEPSPEQDVENTKLRVN